MATCAGSKVQGVIVPSPIYAGELVANFVERYMAASPEAQKRVPVIVREYVEAYNTILAALFKKKSNARPVKECVMLIQSLGNIRRSLEFRFVQVLLRGW